MKSSKITARLLSAVLAIMMLFSLVTVGFTASAANVEIAETGVTMTGGEKLYLTPNSNWNIDNARFAIYVFGSGNAWASMTKVSGESNLYEVTVPTGSWTNVIFCRMNPANNVNDWGSNGSHKWNQTSDLTYDGTNNHYTVKEGTWDKGGGTWSVYTPPVPAVAPATPATATVTISGNLGGTGTEADPFLVAPETAMNMVISGAIADDATGLAYNVDYTASKVDLGAGETSVLYTGATAPAVDVAKAVNVYLWAYQATNSDKAYSEEYATTTIYVKGYEATVDPDDPVVDNSFDLPYENADGLYAYAGTEVSGTNAWQRWHQNNDVRHFFLAPTASDTEVIVLNTYSSDVFLNGVMIPAGEYATVPYVDGTTYTCSGATTQKVYIAKTDAEGAIYVNSQDGMVTVNDDAAETETEVDATYDLYAFLTGGTKNREAKSAAGAVASEDGINEAATIKKIKGRGNSTWGETKKPFNITYKDNVQVDGMKGKKWSLLANAKDGSLLRNRLVYDMANEISMVYACDSRFVDFFVNGYYKGSYQLTQKIEMGKNTVMPDLEEPEVEDVTEDDGTVTPYPKENFDFILELDTESNATSSNDRFFNSKQGQTMTYKTPDDPATEQAAFIQAKYQALEDALYGDDMAALEQILDLNDFAKAYLINEVSKNIDAGVTSCYFVYSSADDMFYASPVWDFDNAIGNLPDNGARTDMNGKVLDLDGPTGWYTRDLKHFARNARNVFGQAWYNTSKTADGKSFQDIVLEVWNADFADIVDILNGDATANGRLKSYEAYMQNLTKTGTWNQKADGAYVTADWKANKTSLAVYNYNAETNTYTTENKEYPATFEGETEYAVDWTISRINWMAAQYAEASVDVPDGYITIYFENNWNWPDPSIHMWGSALQSDTTWPGKALTNVVGQNDAGYDIYEIVIPEDLTGIIFNGTGEYGTDQTDDITSGWYEGICYYMIYDDATATKTAGTYDYKVPEEEETTTPAESEPASEDETETTAPEEETTTPVVDAETVTIYVENNWKWADGSIYFWGSATAENPAWPGIAYTDLECVGQNTDGVDIYKVELPADATGFLLVGTGSYGEDKSADVLEWAEGDCFYMVYDETLAAKVANSHPYSDHVTVDPTTPDEEETTAPEEETTTPVVDAETVTIYVENNWKWADGSIYFWGSTTAENPAWPGIAYTDLECVGQNTDGVDIYKVELPADATGFLLVGTGSYGEDKSADVLEWAEGDCFYMVYDETLAAKVANSHPYSDHVVVDPTTPDEEETTAPEEETTPVTTGDEPSTPVVETVVVYAINSANWADVYAYIWDIDPAEAWPGIAMQKTGDTVNGFDVYAMTFESKYVNVIFNNNNNGSQTDDLTVMDGQYYDIKGKTWYASLEDVPAVDTLATNAFLVGSFNGWDTLANEFKYAAEGDTTATITLTLEAATDYQFKIVRDSAWTSAKETVTITSSIADLTFSSSIADNVTLTTTEAGEYTFTWTPATSKLTIVYPGDDIVDIPTPDEPPVDTTVKLAGSFTDWATGAIEMIADETGKVYTAVVDLTADTYEFKIVEFGTWLGNTGTIENTAEGWTFRNKDAEGNDVGNCTLTATGGTYTFTFDTETDKLTVTAVLDEITTPDEPVVETYTVIFLNADGTYLGYAKVEAGQSANIPPVMPEMDADAQYTYVFSGWDKDFSAVTEDMIVTAMYDKVVNKYTVTFLDKDGNEIDKVEVEYGAAAVAPAAPAVDGYTFKGWTADITNVTNDMTVKAQYSKVVEAATTGKLSVEVSGGAGFTISVAGGAARPQGTSYYNTKMPMNTSVTLVANAAEGMEFLGWVNANMVVLSTEETYTFITTGNDFAKAVYRTDLDGASLVIFKNDKAAGGNGAILDLQYYVAGEEIVIPANPAQAGYDFAGWDMTAEEIAAKVAAGENVTVLATWTVAEVFVNVTVNGGTFVASKVNADGKIYANYAVTATANAAEAGKKFAYWADAETGEVLSYNAEYKFYPGKDTEITAIYVATDATVDYKVLVGMSADPNAEPTKIRYYVTYYVPEAELGYEFVSAGVIIVDEANYKEDMFYHGSGLSGMTDTAPGSIQIATGNQPGAAVTKGNCFSGNTYYAKTWVIYKDAQGVEQIAYSDLLVIDKL